MTAGSTTASPRWGVGWSQDCQADLLAEVAMVRRGTASPLVGSASMVGHLSAGFSLSDGQRELLVLAAAAELDPAAISGDPAVRSCCDTVLSAVDALEQAAHAEWSDLSPSGPLRRWRLVHLSETDPLHGSVRIDERVLFALLGVHTVDPALQSIGRPLAPVDAADRLPTVVAAAADAARHWATPASVDGMVPVLDIAAADRGLARRTAVVAAEHLGLGLWEIEASVLPTAPDELDALAVLLERDAVLADLAVLLVDDDGGPEARRSLVRLIDRCSAPVAVIGAPGRRDWRRATTHVGVAAPPHGEVASMWREALGPLAGELDAEIGRLAYSFELPVERLHDVARATIDAVDQGASAPLQLWARARQAARGSLEGLAQRVDATAGWADLIVPPVQRRALHEIAAHVRQRQLVGDHWGFAKARGDNLAVTALFHGPSGVGKTLAARVLAHELELDLYRVDLSQTVSKFVGETEKNLKEIFDRAEQGNAVLVFDEADALFGKRSEVHDAHDRYANIEVSYLLQRMESYRGLALLTTNLPANLDPAFLRRLRHRVAFPFPDQSARRDIWRRAIPPDAPCADLDFDQLSRLGVSGAGIANIALGAAVLAAEEGTAIGMAHLRAAAFSEYAKHDRAPSAGELRGWPVTVLVDGLAEPATDGCVEAVGA